MQEPPERKEAPGNSQNNPGTRWNLAVQSRNCSVVNSTILERSENFLHIDVPFFAL